MRPITWSPAAHVHCSSGINLGYLLRTAELIANMHELERRRVHGVAGAFDGVNPAKSSRAPIPAPGDQNVFGHLSRVLVLR